jgi:hypothetical protein
MMMDAATLDLLWARFLDGDELDPAEEALLADALDDDPELRDRFLRDHDIDAALQWLPRTHLGEATFVANVLQKWNDVKTMPIASTNRAEQVRQGAPSGRTRRWLLRWSPTAVAALLLIGAVGVMWKPDRREVVASLGTMAPSADARWNGDQPSRQLTAEPMQLASGEVQMLLADGVQVTAQGSAEWRLMGTGRFLAQRGNFSVVVPKRAIGFTIQTPTAIVVDLGTEFEVEVDKNGDTNVQVERGTVEVATIPRAGVPSTRRRLGAGEHHRVDRFGKGDAVPETPSAPKPKFRGAVAIDGQVREFDDEAAFQKAVTDARNVPTKKPIDTQVAENKPAQPLRGLDRVAKEAEEQAKKVPPSAAENPRPAANEKFGVFTCNLRTIEFSNLDEFEDAYLDFTRESDAFARQFEQMQKQIQQNMGPFANGFRQFGFVNVMLSGSITWGDKRWEFTDRKSLDRARQQLRRHLDSEKAKDKEKASPKAKAKPAADKEKSSPKAKPVGDKAGKKAALRPWREIDWHKSIADACKQAAGEPGPEDDKPVFVFRVLGDMNGFM